jgi:hypothetical protein
MKAEDSRLCPTYSYSANRKDQSATLVFFGYNVLWINHMSNLMGMKK